MCLHVYTSCHSHAIACRENALHAHAGADGAFILLNKQHGSIIWGLKIHGMHPAFATKNDTWIPLGVVQGPTEPKMMESILQSFLEFFMAHDLGEPSRPWCMHVFTRTQVALSAPVQSSWMCRPWLTTSSSWCLFSSAAWPACETRAERTGFGWLRRLL